VKCRDRSVVADVGACKHSQELHMCQQEVVVTGGRWHSHSAPGIGPGHGR
jgi:hypothetical protein